MFVGPTLIAPLMLLSVYGLGSGTEDIPWLIRAMMSLSYLRYGLEGIVVAVYGGNRANLPCPPDEDYCMYVSPEHLLHDMGMPGLRFSTDLAVLVAMFVALKAVSFYLLRQRLSPNGTFAALHVIGRLVKSQLGTAPR